MNIFNNLPIKIICLVLAFGFWAFVSFQTGRIGIFPADIPIKVNNVSDNLLPILSNRSVKIKISAQPQIWQALSEDDFRANIDLAAQKTGIHEVAVKVVSLNPQVKIVQVLPDKIQVNLEKIIRQTSNVEVEFQGTPSQGYVVTGYQVNPAKVTLQTAKSIWKKVAKVVAKVNVADESNDFKRIYKLSALDNQGNPLSQISFQPEEVEVNVQIGRSGNIRTVSVEPKFSGEPAIGYWVDKISVNPAVIAIHGATNQIFQLNQIETKPISLQGKKEDFQTEALLVFPNGINPLENIKTVSVSVTFKPAVLEKEILTHQFKFIHLKNGLDAQITQPNEVKIKVSGAVDKINALSEKDVYLQFDLTDLTLGNHRLNLNSENIYLPESIQLVEFTPKEVEVKIVKK